MTIVKVQLPQATNTPELADVALIYGEGRARMTQQRLDPATRAAMGGDDKAFFEATYREGSWRIGARVEDCPW
jgi:hypothetical protein